MKRTVSVAGLVAVVVALLSGTAIAQDRDPLCIGHPRGVYKPICPLDLLKA